VFLVDTSVWIDFLRAADPPSGVKLDEILAEGDYFLKAPRYSSDGMACLLEAQGIALQE
jgi:hypothetical protein